jgi:hypothetical protein
MRSRGSFFLSNKMSSDSESVTPAIFACEWCERWLPAGYPWCYTSCDHCEALLCYECAEDESVPWERCFYCAACHQVFFPPSPVSQEVVMEEEAGEEPCLAALAQNTGHTKTAHRHCPHRLVDFAKQYKSQKRGISRGARRQGASGARRPTIAPAASPLSTDPPMERPHRCRSTAPFRFVPRCTPRHPIPSQLIAPLHTSPLHSVPLQVDPINGGPCRVSHQ